MFARRWSFLAPFLLFNLICTGVLYALLGLFEIPFGTQQLATVVYFIVLGIGLHTWQGSALDTDPKLSVQRYMTGMVLKMLLTLLVLLVAIVKMPKVDVVAFVLPFIGFYLANLAFSTVRFSALLRQRKP